MSFWECCSEKDRKVMPRTDNDEYNRVRLRVYDLSKGLMDIWSPILLQRHLKGMWHTGVHVFGYEYFFGGGIVKLTTDEVNEMIGIDPYEVVDMGLTNVSKREFESRLVRIKRSFCREVYDLTEWNCNHFSDYIMKFLTGKSIPSYILDLPSDVEASLFGRVLISAAKYWFQAAPLVEPSNALHPKHKLTAESESDAKATDFPRMNIPDKERPVQVVYHDDEQLVVLDGVDRYELPRSPVLNEFKITENYEDFLASACLSPKSRRGRTSTSTSLDRSTKHIPVGSPSGRGRAIADRKSYK